MTDLIERLRVTRLLSQRNQYALQADAADQLEAQKAEIARLREALECITDSEPMDGDSFVCDFDTLQGVARAALRARGVE